MSRKLERLKQGLPATVPIADYRKDLLDLQTHEMAVEFPLCARCGRQEELRLLEVIQPFPGGAAARFACLACHQTWGEGLAGQDYWTEVEESRAAA